MDPAGVLPGVPNIKFQAPKINRLPVIRAISDL
jgi:hypothetical protein